MRASLLALIALVACKNDIGLNQQNNVAPGASIASPVDQSTFTDIETIELTGRVDDSNGLSDIVDVSWSSNLDGTLAEGLEFDGDGITMVPVNLSVGQHIISLSVVDAGGLEDVDSVTIVVEPADQVPEARIVSPTNLQQVLRTDAVGFSATVEDPNQPSNEIQVVWEVLPSAGGAGILVSDGFANAQGISNTVWTNLPPVGEYTVRVTAVGRSRRDQKRPLGKMLPASAGSQALQASPAPRYRNCTAMRGSPRVPLIRIRSTS